MTGTGIGLTLLVGRTPTPAPPAFIEALDNVEVTHTDQGASGFQITFRVGRDGERNLADFQQVASSRLEPFSRVILVVHFGAVPKVLMDGIITHQQLAPAEEPGGSTFTVTGEDVSVMMDREERQEEHPAQSEMVIANKILARYARYGVVPKVIAPKTVDVPVATERVPVQSGTDLQYLRQMAERHGYVFYVTPGPAPFTSQAYWGPPKRSDKQQSALTIGMGHMSNVESIHFENDALRPTFVSGRVQDPKTHKVAQVKITGATRKPALARTTVKRADAAREVFRGSGLTSAQARGRAQARTDLSMDQVVTATGELDAVRYGHLLQAHGVVGVRGAGKTYDGLYYVQSVTHKLSPGSYKQSFTLTREGLGSTIPMVVP
ncbi:MAG TPA: hypothetical protein VE078_02250 [Thermoanaerobaculia bacterium]|nr:hypothetical protein [Thermoanaerobaculia bacterium]